MLIILGLILLALAIWVAYLMIIGGVGLGVALKQIFTGFRVNNDDPKLIAARERRDAERARTVQIVTARKAARRARKEARNGR